MASKVLFAPMKYARYEATQTLPAKFGRMLEKVPLGDMVNGKKGRHQNARDGITYSTIPPVFITILVDYIHKHGGDCFITDDTHPARAIPSAAATPRPIWAVPYWRPRATWASISMKRTWNTRRCARRHGGPYTRRGRAGRLFARKGHGSCGFGGQGIAMGCVTDHATRYTRSRGGLVWDKDKCVHCKLCIPACNHHANSFTTDGKDGVYKVNYHHCTMCQHCLKVCPKHAITLDSHDYADFQSGMALTTKTVLDTFAPGSVYFINVLTMITALCDCWGMTTPSLVPDIGIMASDDIVAIERASIDAIKVEDLIPVGVPAGMELGTEGHLFQRLHGKNPYVQLDKLEACGLGTQEYELVEIR